MKRIAILASGSGSNAENIVQHFKNHPEISVSCIVCNRREAKVFEASEKNCKFLVIIFQKQIFIKLTKCFS